MELEKNEEGGSDQGRGSRTSCPPEDLAAEYRTDSPGICAGLSFLGIIPGGGGIIANFMAYIMEKRLSKHPERFGKGEIAGVAGPESANNAAAGGAFYSLLSLGIPMNATVALLFAALLIHGVRPGPLLISEHPEIFWGIRGGPCISET